MPDVELVVFDYGNVLARVDHTRFLPSLLGNGAAVLPVVYELIYGSGAMLLDLECGRIDGATFQARIEQTAGRAFPPEVFRAAYNALFEPLPSPTRLALDLVAAGRRIGLLSNTSDLHLAGEIARHPAFRWFDPVIVSFRVGAMKPAEAMFSALEAAVPTIDPTTILYLDDLADNIAAAHQRGWQTILVADPDQAAAQARQRTAWPADFPASGTTEGSE
jgi:HAD superfamily hydrolase (TIGR01509 family)